MTHNRASEFLVGIGETMARAIMLGLIVIAVILLTIACPVIGGWLIYDSVKRRPHETQLREYAIVD